MASSLRLGSSALRSSLVSKPVVQSAALNGVRCYSAAKAKVRLSAKTPQLHVGRQELELTDFFFGLVTQGNFRRQAACRD